MSYTEHTQHRTKIKTLYTKTHTLQKKNIINDDSSESIASNITKNLFCQQPSHTRLWRHTKFYDHYKQGLFCPCEKYEIYLKKECHTKQNFSIRKIHIITEKRILIYLCVFKNNRSFYLVLKQQLEEALNEIPREMISTDRD